MSECVSKGHAGRGCPSPRGELWHAVALGQHLGDPEGPAEGSRKLLRHVHVALTLDTLAFSGASMSSFKNIPASFQRCLEVHTCAAVWQTVQALMHAQQTISESVRRRHGSPHSCSATEAQTHASGRAGRAAGGGESHAGGGSEGGAAGQADSDVASRAGVGESDAGDVARGAQF